MSLCTAKATTELALKLCEDLKLVHGRCMGLKGNRDLPNSNAKVLVIPNVANLNLASHDVKIKERECNQLRSRTAADEDDSICCAGKTTRPSLNKFSSPLCRKALVHALKGFGLRIISPVLILTTVAWPDLNDRANIVPDINAKIVHAANNSGVIVSPLLVTRLFAFGSVIHVTSVNIELNVALVAVGDFEAQALTITDGLIGYKLPLLFLLTGARFNNSQSG